MGRDQELERLHKNFTTGKGLVTQALTGLGGIGKTQTALEYAKRYREEYQTVFWAQAENREVLFGDMTTLAGLLQLPAHNLSEQKVVVGAVTRWLEVNTHWLLILDNVDDLALVRELLPSRWLIKSGTDPAANEGGGWFEDEGSVLGWRRSDAHSPQADGSDRRGD